MGFVHLHLHSEYSLLDGATKISELFEYVKGMGQSAVAITEHGNMGAVIKKYELAKKAGVKLIMGFEPYITKDLKGRDKNVKNHVEQLLDLFFKKDAGNEIARIPGADPGCRAAPQRKTSW